jgi:hypothetical protein
MDPMGDLLTASAQANPLQSPYIDFPSIEDTVNIYGRLK